MVSQGAPHPAHPLAAPVSLGTGAAKVPEAPLEVLVQEGIEDGVEAAVGVAQRHAEEVRRHDGGGLGHVARQRLDQDEDVDGRPAHHEDGDHHQHQARDPAEVAVLLARARQEAHALQPHDHQRVAHSDDDDGCHKGEDEDADLHHRVPVDVGLREL